MDWFDFLLWFFVAALSVALVYLEYLRVQLKVEDVKRHTEYELKRKWDK